MTQNQHPLLEIRDLRVSFETHRGIIPAVDGVSINIPRGQTVALVGESGCGKSTAALSILKLIPQPPGRFDGGQVLFCDQDTPPLTKGGRGGGEKHARASLGMPPGHTSSEKFPHPDGRGSDIQTGKTLAGKPPVAPEISVTPENPALVYPNHDREGVAKHGGAALSHGTQKNPPTDLLQLNEKEMQKIRGGKIAMIFQEPLTSLNPVFTVGEQIVEAIELHQPLRGTKAWNKAIEMLDRVGIDHPHQRAMDYPHQLSGGMQQRVMIAMALSCEPDLLIADEPTTALDVTIQAQILELLRSLQKERDMSLLLITHDLGVVAQMADVVYVMYAGKIVEHAPVVELFENPLHPYTQGLLRCTPQIKSSSEMKDHGHNEKLEVIPGKVPDLSALPSGCGFHPRCDLTRRKAAENTRLTISILTESDRPAFSSPTSQRTSTATNQSVVLKNCVESYDTEPSGIPLLHEVRPHHYVACWEI